MRYYKNVNLLMLAGLLLFGSTVAYAQGFEAFGRRGGRRGWDAPAQAPAAAQSKPAPRAAAPAAVEAAAQNGVVPEVDKAEVIRRGNLEEYVDGESRFSNEYGDHIAQIAATPANDNDKWFISVIGKKPCPACDALRQAWASDEVLRAYAKPDLPRESWAHWTWYDYDDPYQKWRWTKSPQNPNPMEITAFPTIVVQPPRNKTYGNPQTVVLKYVWEGDSRKMSEAINTSIRAYVDTLHKKNELKSIEGKESRVAGGGFQSLEADGYCQLDPRDLTAEAPAAGDNGFGQQQIPPLVLPNDRPDFDPRDDRRQDRLISAKPRILLVTDEELVSSPEQDKVVKDTINSIQPAVPVKIYQKDIKDKEVKSLGVRAEEVPVVLLVEGNDIIEKRQIPRVNAEFGGPLLAIWSGLGSVITLLVWVATSLCSMLVFLFIGVVSVKTLQHFEILPKPLWGGSKAPQPAPAPAPAPAAGTGT